MLFSFQGVGRLLASARPSKVIISKAKQLILAKGEYAVVHIYKVYSTVHDCGCERNTLKETSIRVARYWVAFSMFQHKQTIQISTTSDVSGMYKLNDNSQTYDGISGSVRNSLSDRDFHLGEILDMLHDHS